MKTLGLTLLATAAMTAGASAQILAAFDVSGSGTTNAALAPVATSTTVAAGSLTRGTGLNYSSTANAFNSSSWNTTATLDTSTATGRYVYFDITAGTGAVTFSTLQFATFGSATSPNTGTWAYTLDGGTTFTLGTTANGGAFTNTTATPTAQSTWDFTDFTLAPGASVEFRFFEYGATSISGGTSSPVGTTRIANISGTGNPRYDLVVNGPIAVVQPVNAAVPEPSTHAAVALGGLGAWIMLRSRRRHA